MAMAAVMGNGSPDDKSGKAKLVRNVAPAPTLPAPRDDEPEFRPVTPAGEKPRSAIEQILAAAEVSKDAFDLLEDTAPDKERVDVDAMFSALNKWKRSTGAAVAVSVVAAAVAFSALVKRDDASSVQSDPTPRDQDDALPPVETRPDTAGNQRPRTALQPLDDEPVSLPPATRPRARSDRGNATLPGGPTHNSWTTPPPLERSQSKSSLLPAVKDSKEAPTAAAGAAAGASDDDAGRGRERGRQHNVQLPPPMIAQHRHQLQHDASGSHQQQATLPRSVSLRPGDEHPKITVFRIIPLPQALPGQPRAMAKSASMPALGAAAPWLEPPPFDSSFGGTGRSLPTRGVGTASFHADRLSAGTAAPRTAPPTGKTTGSVHGSRASPPRHRNAARSSLHFPDIGGPNGGGLSDRLMRQLQMTYSDWKH